MPKTFTFFIDPGHGWLKVTRGDCLDLGLTVNDFSGYSYLGAEGAVYLEEDCDASKFLRAYEAKHGSKPTIATRHCNGTSSIRRMRRNEPVNA